MIFFICGFSGETIKGEHQRDTLLQLHVFPGIFMSLAIHQHGDHVDWSYQRHQ